MQEFNIVYSIDGGSKSFATISWDNNSGWVYWKTDKKTSVLNGMMIIDKILNKRIVYEAGVSRLGVLREVKTKGTVIVVKKYAMTKDEKLFDISPDNPVTIPINALKGKFETHISVAYAVCRYMEKLSDKSHEIYYKPAQLTSEKELIAKGMFLCGPGDPT